MKRYRFIKRGMDIAAAAVGLFVLWPVIAGVALLIRRYLGKPVLFKQMRPGRGGKPFLLHKFRTMRDATDPDGQPLPDAERLTAFGLWLRRLSLDELPQLWNVLKGDMSVIGPRPLLMEYLPLYSPAQARRHEVRPGITGWAQVNGRNALSWEEKFRLDVWYVDNMSFLLDMKILFMTVGKVFGKADIYREGEVSVAKFTGSPAEPAANE